MHKYGVCLVCPDTAIFVQSVIRGTGDTSLIVVGKRARKLSELGDWWVEGAGSIMLSSVAVRSVGIGFQVNLAE